MNSMVNTSVLLMSVMMGAFSDLMVNTTGEMAAGMAEALGGEEASAKVKEELQQKRPVVSEKMKEIVSDIRKDLCSQMQQRKQELKSLLADSVFEVGPRIIDRYDFGLPKLTQELDDNTLTQYSQLLMGENPEFGKMFKGLAEWLNSLPMPSKDK